MQWTWIFFGDAEYHAERPLIASKDILNIRLKEDNKEGFYLAFDLKGGETIRECGTKSLQNILRLMNEISKAIKGEKDLIDCTQTMKLIEKKRGY